MLVEKPVEKTWDVKETPPFGPMLLCPRASSTQMQGIYSKTLVTMPTIETLKALCLATRVGVWLRGPRCRMINDLGLKDHIHYGLWDLIPEL